ncbi:hypothetical protein [uncultured Tateyamaria sp.]|uniref:hypothetical protein n=1 Tax=uncultured Tateyamaria sp. TaxID=455651 RepID=UPI002620F541|nr:hypothetical protein [uncultured Tateyamaria sp.]
MTRRYYFTGPVNAVDLGLRSPEEQAAAKAAMRRMHLYWRSIDRGDQDDKNLSSEVIRRIETELERRADVGRTALIRVLQCSLAELEQIHPATFDTLPDILLMDEMGES